MLLVNNQNVTTRFDNWFDYKKRLLSFVFHVAVNRVVTFVIQFYLEPIYLAQVGVVRVHSWQHAQEGWERRKVVMEHGNFDIFNIGSSCCTCT